MLTVARTLGEYGAVIMVSSNLPGQSQTLTLLVSDRYNRGAEYGAYAISTLLMGVSVLVLIVQVILDARLKRARLRSASGQRRRWARAPAAREGGEEVSGHASA